MNMKHITKVATTLLLLSIISTIYVVSFSPSRRPLVTRRSSFKLSIAPADLSFLLSDAADAISITADAVTTATTAVDTADATVSSAADVGSSVTPPTDFSPTYSKASYYTTLALYVASFPGLWSQIKRSTKAKIKRKTYVSPGEFAGEGGKTQRQQAGEIMAYMKANNYEVSEAGETITFRGLVARSTSQAFFLTFCTALGMASLALVLQIQFQDLELPGLGKPNWFLLTLLSPYAGIYYWRSGDRVDDMKVKLAVNDDETFNEITIEGNDEEIDRMWRTLNLQEKGMVRVEGVFS